MEKSTTVLVLVLGLTGCGMFEGRPGKDGKDGIDNRISAVVVCEGEPSMVGSPMDKTYVVYSASTMVSGDVFTTFQVVLGRGYTVASSYFFAKDSEGARDRYAFVDIGADNLRIVSGTLNNSNTALVISDELNEITGVLSCE